MAPADKRGIGSGRITLSEILGEQLGQEENKLQEFDPERRVKTALAARPGFSVMMRLTLLFSVALVLTAGITAASWVILSQTETSVEMVAVVEAFSHEVEEARRYEKNYFLYRSDLTHVVEHLNKADSLLRQASSDLALVVSTQELETLRQSLDAYRQLIDKLIASPNDESFFATSEFKQLESAVRDNGSTMLDHTLAIARAERTEIADAIALAKKVFLILALVLLPFYVYIGMHIYRHILARLTRLMDATQRIANGDFSPILPTRKYKDEFTTLAIALNHMMHEIERRHHLLVESHKMRAVGNLTAGVAHELNNPLNNIMLTSEMLKEDWDKLPDAGRLEMVDELLEQTDRARSVVKNLLDFARESEAEVERHEVDGLLQEVIRLAQNQIKISKIKLHVDVPEGLLPVLGDRGLLIQVFLNLILNAIDAMPNGGHLFVRAAEEEETGFITIHVQDTGTGIPSHVLTSIFDPFFTTKPTGKGTGLGLAVSQGIVNQHGGDIEVMSKVGVGTTFSVHLPSVPVPAKLAEEASDISP